EKVGGRGGISGQTRTRSRPWLCSMLEQANLARSWSRERDTERVRNPEQAQAENGKSRSQARTQPNFSSQKFRTRSCLRKEQWAASMPEACGLRRARLPLTTLPHPTLAILHPASRP
ncbi:hypothetical protein CPAR01_08615, partial [Colletotrichum paranaense]